MLDDLKIGHIDLEVIKNIIQETERIYGEMITSISNEHNISDVVWSCYLLEVSDWRPIIDKQKVEKLHTIVTKDLLVSKRGHSDIQSRIQSQIK